MVESKNLNEVLTEIIDDEIFDTFQKDGWFDKITYMSPNGMLALVISIVWAWMNECLKKDTPLSIRYDMAKSFGKAVIDMLTDSIKEKYDK